MIRQDASLVSMILICGASVALETSCVSAMIDLRDIDQPIVLNDNPIMGVSQGAQPGAEIELYDAAASRFEYVHPWGWAWKEADSCQDNAFKLIGGKAQRAITSTQIQIEADGTVPLVFSVQRVRSGVSGWANRFSARQLR